MVAEAAARPTAALLDLNPSPISPLVEAKLLAMPQAAWIERAEIRKLVNERELVQVLGAEAVSRRAALGRLLKAQILVILRGGKKQDVSCVELVVCETDGGLRLLARTLPLSDDPQADAAALTALVGRAIERHGEAIREIYAVPPLVSKNLTYQHDYLRTAYGKLIEQLLLEQPGVLVVELAEAEAIAREMQLSGEIPTRRLPLFVLGEYRHEPAPQGAVPAEATRVSVHLSVRRGEKPLAEAAERAPAAQVPDFFRRALAGFAKAIDAQAPARATVDREEEFRELSRQAAAHQRLGNWSEALALAEAALLLKPDQPQLNHDAVVAITALLPAEPSQALPRLVESLQLYRRGLCHVDVLLRVGAHPRKFARPGGGNFLDDFISRRCELIDPALPDDVKALMQQVQQEHRDVLTRFTRFLIERGQWQLSGWYFRCAISHLDPRQQYAEVLKMVLELQDQPDPARWLPVFARETQKPEALDMAEGREFRANLSSAPAARPAIREGAKRLEEEIRRFREQWERWTTPTPPEPLAEVAAPGRLHITPIALTVAGGAEAAEEARRMRCAPAGPGVDLFWDNVNLYLMKTKGQLRPIVRLKPNPYGVKPAYDGRYLWILLKSWWTIRVLVIDPAGERVWELTRGDGLPLLTEDELRVKAEGQVVDVAAVAPGKACLAGGFGRGWIAMVTFDPAGRHRVQVFHEARETANGEDRQQWKKPTVAFRPVFMAMLRGRDAKGQIGLRLLIAREGKNLDLLEHPLLVDAEKLSVEVVQEKFWRPDDFDVYDGAIYFLSVLPRSNTLALYRAGLPDLKPVPVIKNIKEGIVVSSPDHLNVVGKQWWSGRPTDGRLTCAGNVPSYYSNRYRSSPPDVHGFERDEYQLVGFDKSSHYGLVACYSNDSLRDPAHREVMAQVALAGEAEPPGTASQPKADGPAGGPPRKEPPPGQKPQDPSLETLAAEAPLTPELLEAAAALCPRQVWGGAWPKTVTAAMSPDGLYLAVGTWKGSTIVWSLKTGEPLRALPGHDQWIWALGFSPDGKRLVTYGLERNTLVWDVESGQVIVRTIHKNLGWDALVFSPDGKLLVAANQEVAEFWNLDTRRLEYRTAMFAQVGGFLPDGTLLARANDSRRRLITWDPKTWATRCLAPESRGQLLAIAPDGKRVAMWEAHRLSGDRLVASSRVIIWDLLRQRAIVELDCEGCPATAAVFSADGGRFTALLVGRGVRTWTVPDKPPGKE
jgi:hypothetical protein